MLFSFCHDGLKSEKYIDMMKVNINSVENSHFLCITNNLQNIMAVPQDILPPLPHPKHPQEM
jgi:hypothetical protein